VSDNVAEKSVVLVDVTICHLPLAVSCQESKVESGVNGMT
jgi:hypothetical protein